MILNIQNVVRVHQKQSQGVQNAKISWGSMPPDPLEIMCMENSLAPLDLILACYAPLPGVDLNLASQGQAANSICTGH